MSDTHELLQEFLNENGYNSLVLNHYNLNGSVINVNYSYNEYEKSENTNLNLLDYITWLHNKNISK